MKKYFDNLRPLERRMVIGVGVVLVIVLNWAFIWPHFSDAANYKNRLDAATQKLKSYQTMVGQAPALQKQLDKFQSQGQFVELEEQGLNFVRTINNQAIQSGVGLQSATQPQTHTNDVFFVEQVQNINVLAEEKNLVDFLFKLGSDSSMIRVRDLSLQPDPPRQRLSANIRLVANYQKNAAAGAGKNATAKAK